MDAPGEWAEKDAFVMPLLPADLSIDPLLASLLHCMAFLEISGDDAVDPDYAVEALEHVASYLQRLRADRISSMQVELERVAQYAEHEKWPREFVEFARTLLQSSGVIEDEA